MAKLTQEVLTAIEKTKPTCIATASSDGIPNLIYVTYVKAAGDDMLVVADNKFNKTRKNLDSNPHMSVAVLDPDTMKSYQIKCTAECVTEGERYDSVVKWVHVKHPQLTPKAAFYLTVDEVYSGADRIA
ncbi:pyridoxamine 5'-phosphate oxidase family protein [Sediminispirochaeta bajacaliforniensis]|uniref:pyridoxamine 5'-phosphate oxidase family protein n=1 Tax=Sediminispirochaeta bajacaliforniensis TaxID=148 RepID=UPI00037E0717|nr:pyridoxamine 5'-phosphate oxidase family protein [Sediminispirochaeta bajacaliforniensis]